MSHTSNKKEQHSGVIGEMTRRKEISIQIVDAGMVITWLAQADHFLSLEIKYLKLLKIFVEVDLLRSQGVLCQL